MSHGIDIINNRPAYAHVNDAGWHGLSNPLPVNAPLERWKELAGLDWEAIKGSVEYVDAGGNRRTMNGRKVIYRSDNGEALSVMSDGYKIVQPGDVLEFYRDMVAESGAYDLETAGCLFGGRKLWALAKHRDELNVMGDITKPYMLLTTSLDGSSSTICKPISIRVVCANTLAMGLGGTSDNNAVRVTHSSVFDQKAVKHQLANIDDFFASWKETAEKLASIKVDQREAKTFVAKLYGPEISTDFAAPLADPEAYSTRMKNKCRDVMRLYRDGPGADLKSAAGTVWGLLNAVTRYEDHHAPTRGGDAAESRFASAQYGAGASRKANAAALADSLASMR